MVLAENNFSPKTVSVHHILNKLVRYCWVLLFIGAAVIVGIKGSFAGDWTPCEAPCSDAYTNIGTPSPASGSSHPTSNTVRFSIDAERLGSFNFLPFQPEVSTSGGTGWSAALVSPSEHCIYASGYQAGCTSDGAFIIKFGSWPNSLSVSIEVDVTIGTGTTRVSVRMANATGTSYITPIFYFDVSASASVRVTNLTDMPNTWNGSGDEENNDDICVYSSETNYDVLVSGPVDGGSYVLESGGNKIPITVYWNDTTGVSGRTTLDSADDPSLASVTGGDNSSETCGGGNTANLSWKALEADMQTKPAGTYSATMTVTVSTP